MSVNEKIALLVDFPSNRGYLSRRAKKPGLLLDDHLGSPQVVSVCHSGCHPGGRPGEGINLKKTSIKDLLFNIEE
jgi:hypothetical protein